MRNFSRKTMIKTACGVGAILLLASCASVEGGGEGNNEEQKDTNGNSGSQAAPPSPLIFESGQDFTTLDPTFSFDVSGAVILDQIYESLVEYDENNDIVGDVAESWEVNDDATQYTFKLREDVVFSTGNPMTSADVLFSYNRLQNAASPSTYLTEGLSFSAPDEYTFVIDSDQPRPELLSMLMTANFTVFDSTTAKELGATDAEDAATADSVEAQLDTRSIGSGPYYLSSYEPNSEVVIEYNEYYRGDKPDFEKVIFRNAPSPQQQILNIENGGSDATMSLSGPQVAGLDASKVNILTTPTPQVIYMALTNSGGPTVNKDFRKAVALGIDYDGLVALAGEGGKQGTGVIPTMLDGAIPDDEVLKRDVDEAKKALAASGQADEKISISYGSDYTIGGQDMGVYAQKIQSSLEEIGMNVELDGAPTQVSRTANQEGKVQVALWPFPPDYADMSQFLIHSPGGILAQRAHWGEDAEDAAEPMKLADEALAKVDQADRIAAYQDWARSIRDTYRFIGVLEVPQNLVTSKRVENLHVTPVGTPRIDDFVYVPTE